MNYKNNETLSIGSLIDSSIFAKSLKDGKLQDIIKHSTIFSFWGEIVGRKFEKITKPYAIKKSIFYVSVKSPVVAQELSLNKKILIKKINSYSMPLGYEIKDIVFNFKNFEVVTSNAFDENKEGDYSDDNLIWYNCDELDKIELSISTIEKIRASVSKISFLNNEQKEKLILKIIQNHKAEILRKTS